jgi:hypothetical protein
MLAQILDPRRYQWHPEVWVLVALLTGAYVYMVRVIGPKAVAPGTPVVTRFNIGCFIGAMVMLWVAEFKNTGAGGKSVWLTTADGDKFFNAHLDQWEGESRDVDLGEVIGYVGSTGSWRVPERAV